MLIEKKYILEEPVLANLINKCFTNITNQLNLKMPPQLNSLEDIDYYHEHICIKKIRSSSHAQSETFTFNYTSSDEIKLEILNLINKQALRERSS